MTIQSPAFTIQGGFDNQYAVPLWFDPDRIQAISGSANITIDPITCSATGHVVAFPGGGDMGPGIIVLPFLGPPAPVLLPRFAYGKVSIGEITCEATGTVDEFADDELAAIAMLLFD